jgi:xylose dehydrogenase (NAD/NADP)
MKNRKLQWGILGTAKIAKEWVIPAIRRSEFSHLLAVASSSGKAAQWAEEQGIEKYYDSYQALLDDPDLDVIYIPLPNHLHAEWTIKAAQAGKHVLCEKPATLTSEEMLQVMKACKMNQNVYMEAFMYRFHPQHTRVREIIREGRIGQVKMIRANNCFMLQNKEQNIRTKKDFGGGALYDVGGYVINALRYLLDQEPISVYASARFEHEIDMTTVGILTFDRGVIGVMECSFEQFRHQEYEVIGTEGRVRVPYAFQPNRRGGVGLIEIITEKSKESEEIMGDQFLGEIREIEDCILNSRQPIYSSENTYGNILVLEALYQSIKQEKVIML